jgi:hypothetical protein
MAEIVNAQLTDLCNNRLRRIADKLSGLDLLSQLARGEYTQRNLGDVITAGGSTNAIMDGSEADGRTRVVGGDVWNLVTLLNDLDTFFATNSRRDVIAKWEVNGSGQV